MFTLIEIFYLMGGGLLLEGIYAERKLEYKYNILK